MKKIEYNRDIKRKWMLLVICFLALLIIIFGCQSSKLKKIDKEPPVTELYSDTIEITEGDEYSPGDNVKSVKDNVDGDITKVDNNLNETGKAYYFIDSSKLDASKVGEYSVKVIARDKAGNEVTKEFIVKVNEKNGESSSSSSIDHNNNSKSDNNNSEISTKNGTSSTSKNNGDSSKGNTPSNNDTSSGTISNNQLQQTCTTMWIQDSAAWDETVVDKEAWDESVEVLKCNACGAEVSGTEWDAHRMADMDKGLFGGYHSIMKIIHHDAITHVVHHEAIGHNEQKCN